jgi:general secretion pathway protein C
MKRLPLVLTLVALAALAASIAYWILQLYQPPQRPIAAAPIVAAAEPSMDAAATLFGGQPATVATNFQLTGVISAGAQSVAIIAATGAPAKALRIGKEVAPGVTVAEVHARYVMLSDGGVMKRIDLVSDAKAAAPMAGAALPPPAGLAGAQPQSPEAAAEQEAGHPDSPGGREEPQQLAAPIPAPPPTAPAVPSAANPPLTPGAVPQPPATAPAQMPAPVRSPGNPVSQPPSSR